MYDDHSQFYAVWCPTAGPPTVSHGTKSSAANEARRLARKHPGRQFYVMLAIERYETADPVTVTQLDDIPF